MKVIAKARWWLAVSVLAAGTVQAQQIDWTGGGANGNWSNPDNWAGGIVPTSTTQVASFGSAASNHAHTIIVDGVYTAQQIRVAGGDAREFTFDPLDAESQLNIGGTAVGFWLESTAATNLTFNVPVRVVHTSTLYTRNSSVDHTLIFNGSFNGGGRSIYVQGRRQVFNGPMASIANIQFDSAAAVDLILRPPSFSASALWFVTGNPATARFGSDITFGRRLEVGYAQPAYLQAIEHGAGTRTVSFGRNLEASNNAAYLAFLENAPGDTGRFILRAYGGGTYGVHYLPMQTASNTVIRLDASGTSQMTYSDNSNRAMRVSGPGSLWKSNTGTLTIRTENTYSGRTMISGGTLQLGSHTLGDDTFYGQLPAATIVELGTNATFNLNGIDQTIGGLTGFRGLDQDEQETFGTVALGGAELTINAAQATSFSGAMTGTGTLAKAGAGTFTLAGGYTNVADRTLRVAGGVLAVTGTMKIEEGAFELAGGHVTAGVLSTTGLTWNVTLDTGYEESILVDVTDADITGAELILALAEGYTPVYGTKFTLLRADDELLGAGPGGILFGYQDGQEFQQSDQWFSIDWLDGSGNIVLTVIPEPGVLILLALASLLGFAARRRR